MGLMLTYNCTDFCVLPLFFYLLSQVSLVQYSSFDCMDLCVLPLFVTHKLLSCVACSTHLWLHGLV